MMPALTAAQIAELVSGRLEGNPDRIITAANSIETATANEVSFAANQKAIRAAESSQAGCLLVLESFRAVGSWTLVRVRDPRAAFARTLGVLYPPVKLAASIHPSAVIAETAQVGDDCFIGPYTTVGDNSIVGAGSYIGEGCAIGKDVRIGDKTTLHANVTIYDRVSIGERVIIHSGCVIGADGFGFTLAGDHYEKFPQVGTVEIRNDVEIGANCCIDRAALGLTRIGEGTKLDNLVHVAHNCSIGKHVVVAAQTGFSGSATVGDYAVIGGQVGIGENAKIESRAIVGGKAGILTAQTVRPGEPVWGIPARPLRQHLKGLANISKLAELRKEMAELKKKIASLSAEQTQSD